MSELDMQKDGTRRTPGRCCFVYTRSGVCTATADSDAVFDRLSSRWHITVTMHMQHVESDHTGTL